eukprot:569415_1
MPFTCIHCFIPLTCFLWTDWIICCILGAIWSLDLIRDANCIDVNEAIPISLLCISGFNCLLVIILMIIFFLKLQSLKELMYLLPVTYVIQLGLHITLFIYLAGVYLLSSISSHDHCDIDDETISMIYYWMAVTIVFPMALFGVACLFILYELVTCGPGGINRDYFEVDEGREAEYLSLVRRKDNDEKPSAAGGLKMNQFRGHLDWEDYKAIYDETTLNKMLDESTFEPLSYEAYFMLIQIEPRRPTSLDEYDRFDDRDDADPLLIGNKLPLQVNINGSNDIQKGYSLYDDENDVITGVYRIVCPTHDDWVAIEEIKYIIGNEPQQTITINHEQNALTMGGYTRNWQQNTEVNDRNCTDIKEAKVCRFKQLGVTLYFEQITVYSSMRFPTKPQCKRFQNNAPDSPEVKQKSLRMSANDMPILFETERNMQVYYNPYRNMVYGMRNATVDISATHCGFGEAHARNECKKYWNGFEYLPYYFENITQPFYMCCRYHFLMQWVLFGSDSQFNVFKTLCFMSAWRHIKHGQLWGRLSVCVLVIIIQSFMTFAVCAQVYQRWDIEEMFDDDGVIVSLSFAVFSFLGYQYFFAVIKFFTFYVRMEYISHVDWIIVIFDFISNIVVGGIVVLSAFVYLMLSDDIQACVMSGFALQFIAALDDMANIFDTDQAFLLAQDWHHCVQDVSPRHNKPWELEEERYERDWDVVTMKRKINLNVPTMILKVCISVVLSPLFYFLALFKLMHGFYFAAKNRMDRMNWTKNMLKVPF